MIQMLGISLVLTVVLELGFAVAWGMRGRRALALVILVNCLTNPPVVLLHHVLVRLLQWPAAVVTAALESAAVLTEWRCYRAFDATLRRPFLFALLANLFSFGMGFLFTLLAR